MERRKKATEIVAKLKELYPTSETILKWHEPWQLLVAVMLSAQTTDIKVNEVTEVLFKKYVSPKDLAGGSLSDLQSILRQVNYRNTKAKHVKEAMALLESDFNGIIPGTIAELMTLPGVGRKTANVVLGNLHNIEEGIAVDTHVRRLVCLWGLSEESDPKKIERDLMKLIPKGEWHKFTNRCIDYGREHCNARCKHDVCPLRGYIAKHGRNM